MWYRTGKINVVSNGTSVAGVGTQWADAKNGVMPGMILLAPDNQLYEIKSVSNNNLFVLSSPYAGSTATGQDYAIITTYEGDISQFSARLSALLTYFQGSRNDLMNLLTSLGDVTIEKDDGQRIILPGYRKVLDSMDVTVKKVINNTRWKMPGTAKNPGWYLLGEISKFTQGGSTLKIDVTGGPGYNGAWIHNAMASIVIRTGDGQVSTVNAAGRAGVTCWNALQERAAVIDVCLIERTANMYEVHVNLGSFINQCFYEISSVDMAMVDNWNHVATKDSVIPESPLGKKVIANLTDATVVDRDYLDSRLISKGEFGLGAGAQHKDDAFQRIYNMYRVTPASANAPLPNNIFGCVSLPIDGGPTTGYMAVGSSGALFTGVSNSVSAGKISWGRTFGDTCLPTVSDIPNLKDWGLTYGVTAARKLDFNDRYFSRRGMVGTDPLGNPFKDVGTYFLDVYGWKAGQEDTKENYRAAQTCYGYGVSGNQSGKMFLRTWNGTEWSKWFKVWTEASTITDTNGYLKPASPVVKLFGDGRSVFNEDVLGVKTERLSEGVYRMAGTLGFNADPIWGGINGGIEIPLDSNKQALIWVDYQVETNGDIIIRSYHRTHDGVPVFARNIKEGYVDGQPIDIPEGRHIDLRVQMPELPIAVEV
ncbi:TPA: hypothetical protein ACXJM1_001799 [Serratia marcescens]